VDVLAKDSVVASRLAIAPLLVMTKTHAQTTLVFLDKTETVANLPLVPALIMTCVPMILACQPVDVSLLPILATTKTLAQLTSAIHLLDADTPRLLAMILILALPILATLPLDVSLPL